VTAPTVREWVPERDRPAVLALGVELQEHERALRPSRRRGEEMVGEYLARIEAHLADPGRDGALFVVEDERGAVAGFLACSAEEDLLEEGRGEVVVQELVVAAGARRRGLARALVDAARRFARERGIERIVVSSLAENEEAQAAYLALGFRPALVTFEADA
jgi:ribosomal protein S18 acetylase RimI-like enzyme